MKRTLLIGLLSVLLVGFAMSAMSDDVKVKTIVLTFSESGEVTGFVVRAKVIKDNGFILEGKKDYTSALPSAHKAQYETYLAVYENAIKSQMGIYD